MRARRPDPSLLDTHAERRISEAAARGEFDNLPGAGAPLPPEDNKLVPEELRAAYRLRKNAGCLPSELQVSAELRAIEGLLAQAGDGEQRRSLPARMNFLLSRRMDGKRNLQIEDDYFTRIAQRLGN